MITLISNLATLISEFFTEVKCEDVFYLYVDPVHPIIRGQHMPISGFKRTAPQTPPIHQLPHL